MELRHNLVAIRRDSNIHCWWHLLATFPNVCILTTFFNKIKIKINIVNLSVMVGGVVVVVASK